MRPGWRRGDRLLAASVATALLAGAIAMPRTRSGDAFAFGAIALGAAALAWAAGGRLADLGLSRLGALWTGLPPVMAALITRQDVVGEAATGAASSALALSGCIGCIILFRTRRNGAERLET